MDKLTRREYQKEYRKKNMEKELERRKIYYRQNKERIKKYALDWAKKNPEKKREQRRLYKKRHPEKVREQNRRRDCRIRKKVFTHYGGDLPKCVCCGETEDKFLTIDHKNNNGNAERLRIFGHKHVAGNMFYLWIIKNNFPKDLQVLCFNCNFGKARNKGVCPHKETQSL